MNPKISIITVSFNAEKTIEETINSVLSQTYKNIEYIIVDGGSTDNTLNIIKKYKNKISKLLSEKDNGLYDAMNKGVKLAKGEVIYFLNADDVLVNNKVIEIVMKKFEKDDFDLIFGDIECFYPDTKSIVKKSGFASINKIKNGVMPPHQGSFVKKKWLKKYPFNLNYKSSSDFDFFCNLLKENIKIKKIDKIIARMTMGGISSNNISYIETEKIILKNFGIFYYYKAFLKNRFFILTKYVFQKTKLISLWRKINNKFNIT